MSQILQIVRSRLPDRTGFINVLAAASTLVYSWTLLTSFWKVPSWLFDLTIGQILSLYAYGFVTNLIESLLLMAGFTLVSLVLPKRWWRDLFIPRSMAALLVIMGSLIWNGLRYRLPEVREEFLSIFWLWWGTTAGVTLVASWLAGRVGWLRRALEDVADRCLVFLYIYVPLTVVAVVIVLARNVF